MTLCVCRSWKTRGCGFLHSLALYFLMFRINKTMFLATTHSEAPTQHTGTYQYPSVTHPVTSTLARKRRRYNHPSIHFSSVFFINIFHAFPPQHFVSRAPTENKAMSLILHSLNLSFLFSISHFCFQSLTSIHPSTHHSYQ